MKQSDKSRNSDHTENMLEDQSVIRSLSNTMANKSVRLNESMNDTDVGDAGSALKKQESNYCSNKEYAMSLGFGKHSPHYMSIQELPVPRNQNGIVRQESLDSAPCTGAKNP